MIGLQRAAACLLIAVSLAGCIRTFPAVVPSQSAAYTAIRPQGTSTIPDTYPLEPGDSLRVQVFQEPDLSVEKVQIDPAGNVSLPLIGSIRAGGLTTAALEASVRQALGARYLRDPRVSIGLVEAVDRVVSIEGEVKQAGVYPINGQTTLLSALSLARSPLPTTKLNEVMIFRIVNGQRVGGRFDIAMIRAGRADDPQILPNDVVVVGYSRLQGAYRDLLQASPLLNVFTRF